MSLTFSTFSRCRPCIIRSLVFKRHETTTSSLKATPPLYPTPSSTSTKSPQPAFSTPTECLGASLRETLQARPAGVTNSVLDPTPSHLLNLLLADLLPASCHASPVNFFASASDQANISEDLILHQPLPQGYHLAYFPPAVPGSQLLEDGTDTLHFPGPPFVRRLWAGGSVTFHPKKELELVSMKSSICTEIIKDVTVKGTEGNEKVFVQIQRLLSGSERLGSESETQEFSESLHCNPRGNEVAITSVSETRNLVFLREKSREQAALDATTKGKVLKPHLVPDWSVRLTPTPDVLFRWSALTYNAHRIHLDPQYCREVEGHRNMLVHGPLSLVLMLSSLKSQLQPREMIMQFEYRNLAPLYVNEEMRICIKLREGTPAKNETREPVKDSTGASVTIAPTKLRVFDVWIEGSEGGYAVKGVAKLGQQIVDST